MLLIEAFDDHPVEMVADYRTRYGLSWFDAGDTYSWEEAFYLYADMLKDPDSKVTAAKQGADYPMNRTMMVMMDLFDLTMAVNVKKSDRVFYSRPYKSKAKNGQKIKSSALPLSQAKKILAIMNPNNTKE